MKIAVLGTGMVGNSIATKLIQQGHEVKMGSRTAGNEKAVAWVSQNGNKASEGTFSDAAAFGELIFLCLNGAATAEALKMAGLENFAGKIVIDITNPLDFSKGMPPSLFVGLNDSLGEQIQQVLSNAKVVKTLNIVNHEIMVNPSRIPGEPDMLMCGEDAAAKEQVRSLLTSWGWKNIIDLGGIKSARNMEMFVLLWVNLWGALGTPHFAAKYLKAQ